MTDLATFLINSFLGTCIVDGVGLTSKKGGFSLHTVASALINRDTSSVVFFPITFKNLVPTNRLVGVVIVRTILGALCRVVVLPIAVHIMGCVGGISNDSIFSRRVSCGMLGVGRLWWNTSISIYQLTGCRTMCNTTCPRDTTVNALMG